MDTPSDSQRAAAAPVAERQHDEPAADGQPDQQRQADASIMSGRQTSHMSSDARPRIIANA